MTIHTPSFRPRATTLKKSAVLVSRGWDALVEKLGYADATRFIMLIDKGSGDAVKFFADLWDTASAEDIYTKLIQRRAKRNGKKQQ